jgi:hypothetical protein
MTETVNAPGLVFEALGFLVHAEDCGDQHGDGHCGGEHENHHGIVLLVSTTAGPRIGCTLTFIM